ncbi:MAG: SET domain-containing protein-lysine N-methyltransferase [Desulfuromusa sp.]|nr:SET domain-containing protein-lysine N-methyltransferase [Desulfuromusa sp.]
MDFFVDLGALSYKTLKAAKSFFQGEILIDLTTAEEVSEPDYRSIDLGDKHVYHPVARYVNHSCEPNAYVDSQQQKLIANSSINKNDEITFNYLASERQIMAPFDCNCASEKCMGRIEKYLSHELYAV